ncbi:DoxX family membrane protein [Sunxiuqinia sp. A32]|uniref:DoxX family membrane protein n=1 Tax=Sunxiuqinia sp. A32 TaxID=3461496 RepID=UPI00404579F7
MKDQAGVKMNIILVILRIVIGGHLFFSGLVKLFNPNWTAKSFLEGSYGIFKWMAVQSHIVNVVDILNVWVLILAGVALIIGWLERIAALAGILLLGLYYLAYIPLDPALSASVGNGPTYLVNPLLIEVVALIVLFLNPTGKFIGVSRLKKVKLKEESESINEEDLIKGAKSRREVVKSLATVPFLAVFSIPFFNRKSIQQVDGTTGATALGKANVFRMEYDRLKKLNLSLSDGVAGARKGMPYGMIGNLKISRLIGGNRIISKDYCARDLRYVSKLVSIYNTEDRILMTLKNIESQGINTVFLTFRNFQDYQLLNYWKEWGGSLQWISELQTSNLDKLPEIIERNLLIGASALCLSREVCDKWIANGEFDHLPKALEIAQKFDVPVGIGGYYNETFQFVMDQNLQPDFFFKSYHKDTYWSAHPESNRRYMEIYQDVTEKHGHYHDNFWYNNPNEFSKLMKQSDIPWIAFKTNAAGALPTQEGFEYAIRGGADFVCCSMYDFEIGDSIRSLKRAYMNI